MRECSSLSNHDAFRRGGLGKSGLQIGWQNLQKLAIAKEIKKRLDESAMSADEVIQSIGDIGHK